MADLEGDLLGAFETHSVEEIREHTGFDFDCPPAVPETPPPDPQVLAAIRGTIREEIADTYPRFAARLAA